MTEPPRRAPGPTVRTSAPVRLDFAGGWTDVPPFVEREGGLVVNAAIDLRVEVEFEPGGQGLLLQSEDLRQAARIRTASDLVLDGTLDLHKAAVRMLPPGPGTLRSRSQVPAGSGLGSSGALDVALVGTLARVRGDDLTPEEVAREAWQLEAREAGIPGGRQDQFAATFGGFHVFGLTADETEVRPLQLAAGFAAELERRLVLCYTGQSRVSGATIARVMGAYEAGERGVTAALHELKRIAAGMVEALEEGAFERVGALLAANWAEQQRLDPGMSTPAMQALEQAMRAAGALGGKAAGAGAGGAMFFLMREDPEPGRDAARSAGAELLPVRWSPGGVEPC